MGRPGPTPLLRALLLRDVYRASRLTSGARGKGKEGALVRYMIPYVVLRREVMNGSSGITEEQLTLIVRRLLRAVEVDENWYKQEYPDVAQAIDNQNVRSAKHHFTADGYFEGRLPFPHEIDEEWYVKTYTDVAERFDRGEIPSIEQHYAMHGYREGRFPGNV
jgi:hypothetical protein